MSVKIHGVELIEKDDMVIQHQAHSGKPFESESMSAWLDACHPLGAMVDVGAYTGLYSIAAAKSGVDVYAFEPNSVVYDRLCSNVDTNGVDVAVYNCAVGDNNGTCGLQVNSAVKLTSGGRVISTGDIPMITVDSLRLPFVSAIKIDTEGHETKVLKGAIETIKRNLPLIITEALGASDELAQRAILEPLGYTATQADERNLIWSQSSVS